MKTCRETKASQSHIIMYPHLNTNNTLYGGKMIEWLDETAGMSAARLVREHIATATIDNLNFIHPIRPGHSITIETYVSGVGNRSLEVFTKIIGEIMSTGERYLAGTGFMTWAVTSGNNKLPEIKPETAEEKFICGGYEKRREKLVKQRKDNVELRSHLDLEYPS